MFYDSYYRETGRITALYTIRSLVGMVMVRCSSICVLKASSLCIFFFVIEVWIELGA